MCEEFAFSDIDAKLSALGSSMDLNDAEDPESEPEAEELSDFVLQHPNDVKVLI
jgi:hypothetical protein